MLHDYISSCHPLIYLLPCYPTGTQGVPATSEESNIEAFVGPSTWQMCFKMCLEEHLHATKPRSWYMVQHTFPSEIEVDMNFSGYFFNAQPGIPRGRCEVLWFISTKDEPLSQRWSQYMTISVTENAQTETKTTPLPELLFFQK